MNKNKIGIIIDSFKLELKDSVKKAKELGADGIQIYAVGEKRDLVNLAARERRELLDYTKSNGLVVSALCGDLGGYGFAKKQNNPYRIEKTKRIMELAKDLETNVVTTHIGVIPEDKTHSRFKTLQEACEELGYYADSIGMHLAIETGPEKAAVLKGFIESLKSNGIKVNLDPANLVMVTGEDPVQAVHILKDYIVHTHVKDGVMFKQTNPEVIYNFFAEGGIGDLRLEDYFKETPLGQGVVDFKAYLQALESIGYKGFLTIEREVGENPEKDIKNAIDFLKSYINQ